jgi:diaminopimelate decarboxylase
MGMTIEFPQHAPHEAFGLRADELVIGGVTVSELAARVGRTPFYAYDREAITRRIATLRAVLPRGVELHYAIKANPLPDLVRHVAPLVDGLDVASGLELTTALSTAVPRTDISFAGPGKSRAELAQAVAAGIVLNLESERELRVLVEIARETNTRPRVAIRVNPDFELKTSGMKMSGGPKQFGIDAERVPEVLRSLASLPVEFMGFHIFSGSQNLRADAIVEAQMKAVELAKQLAAHAPSPVKILNIGGGFGIPYFPGEKALDVAPIAAALVTRLAEVRAAMPTAKVVIELGRYIVGEAGIYVCRVVDRKISRGQVFLVTDGGLHHHLAASGNFGQVLRKNYPVVVANKVRGGERETASVVGPLCTPLDLLADRMELARADEGDLIAVLQSGAYGYTASPLGFLSHPEPVEILL